MCVCARARARVCVCVCVCVPVVRTQWLQSLLLSFSPCGVSTSVFRFDFCTARRALCLCYRFTFYKHFTTLLSMTCLRSDTDQQQQAQTQSYRKTRAAQQPSPKSKTTVTTTSEQPPRQAPAINHSTTNGNTAVSVAETNVDSIDKSDQE